MDKTALVSLDVLQGAEVVAALESGGIKLNAALWMISPEYEDGRLVLSSDSLKGTDPLKDYERVVRILRKSIQKNLPAMLILRTTDPFIKTLRRLFAKAQAVEGMRLGGQSIGNRYIEDAYVYKIA